MKLLSLVDSSDNEEILFEYDDIISQDFVQEIEKIIETTLTKHNSNEENIEKMVRNLFGIAVEQLQNIMSYSRNHTKKTTSIYESNGLCLLGYCKDREKYYLTTLNHIESEDKDKIISKIDLVNGMDPKEQRKHIRKLLRTGADTHGRGAGVGFFEIAKRSSEKLAYDFKDTEQGIYFQLTIYI